MKKIFYCLIVIFILIPYFFLITGCTSNLGIEDLAYVIAIGLDTTDDDNIELILQFATTGDESSSSGSSMQSTKTSISSVKCKSIDSGIALMNSHISKKINLTHCKTIVISEELAKKGISPYMDSLINNTNLSKDPNIIISICSAKDYLTNVDPIFEGLLSEYYNSNTRSNEYTSYSVNMNLATFYCLLEDSFAEPYASLGTVTSAKKSESVDYDSSINANFLAGDYTYEDKDPIENVGIAAFKKDRFVGKLTGLDSICFLIVTNNFENSTISIPNPFEEKKYIDISTNLDKNTKCYISYSNNEPTIHIDTYLTGHALSINQATSFNTSSDINAIEKSAEIYLKDSVTNFLNKTSLDLKSDICGFGKYAVTNYKTMEDWENANWLANYKNCQFDVNVHFTLQSGSTFSKI